MLTSLALGLQSHAGHKPLDNQPSCSVQQPTVKQSHLPQPAMVCYWVCWKNLVFCLMARYFPILSLPAIWSLMYSLMPVLQINLTTSEVSWCFSICWLWLGVYRDIMLQEKVDNCCDGLMLFYIPHTVENLARNFEMKLSASGCSNKPSIFYMHQKLCVCTKKFLNQILAETFLFSGLLCEPIRGQAPWCVSLAQTERPHPLLGSTRHCG